MFQIKQSYKPWLTIILCLMVTNLCAKTTTPITLTADTITYHNKTQSSEYSNHVRVKYGNSEFRGEHMAAKHEGIQSLTELTITGNPVTFHIHRNPKQSQIRGHANQIILYPNKHLAILAGHASIVNGIEMLEGEKIIYHLSQDSPSTMRRVVTPPKKTT